MSLFGILIIWGAVEQWVEGTFRRSLQEEIMLMIIIGVFPAFFGIFLIAKGLKKIRRPKILSVEQIFGALTGITILTICLFFIVDNIIKVIQRADDHSFGTIIAAIIVIVIWTEICLIPMAGGAFLCRKSLRGVKYKDLTKGTQIMSSGMPKLSGFELMKKRFSGSNRK